MAAGASGVKLVADALSARGTASRARFALFVLEQYLSDWRRWSTKSLQGRGSSGSVLDRHSSRVMRSTAHARRLSD
jgi:hypothetical protein